MANVADNNASSMYDAAMSKDDLVSTAYSIVSGVVMSFLHIYLQGSIILFYGYLITRILKIFWVATVKFSHGIKEAYSFITNKLGKKAGKAAKSIEALHDTGGDDVSVPTESGILKHFGTSFSDPQLLFQAMAQYNFVLSGSRAREVFVPGSASPTSAWNFYICYNEK